MARILYPYLHPVCSMASTLRLSLRGTIPYSNISHLLLNPPKQVLYGIIQKIASSFPESARARYQQAASTFRIPYWDWAAQPPSGDQYFPVSVGGSTTVPVITPQSNGETVQIANPLYSYKFAPLNPESGDFISDQGVPVCTSYSRSHL